MYNTERKVKKWIGKRKRKKRQVRRRLNTVTQKKKKATIVMKIERVTSVLTKTMPFLNRTFYFPKGGEKSFILSFANYGNTVIHE